MFYWAYPITSDDVGDVSDRLHFVTDNNQSALDVALIQATLAANDSAIGYSTTFIDKDGLKFVAISETALLSDEIINSVSPIEILDVASGQSFLSPINASVSSSESLSSNDELLFPLQLLVISDQLTNVSEELSNFTANAFVSTIVGSNESLFIDTEGASASDSLLSNEFTIIYNLLGHTESGAETTSLSVNIDPFKETDSASVIESLLITQSTSVTDQLNGVDYNLINNFLSQQDNATGSFDLPITSTIVPTNDSGLTIHELNVIASLAVNENLFSSESLDDFVIEAHSVFDSATITENTLIYTDSIVLDISTSIESTSEENVLFVIDDTYSSVEQTAVVGTLVVNGHDNATGLSDVNITQVKESVLDVGTSIESVGISTETILYDYASDADIKFVYDDKQKLVNVLFDMRLRRILFNLNTSEDHTDGT